MKENIGKLLKSQEARTAITNGAAINGKTFQEWLGWTSKPAPDAKTIRADLQEFAKIMESLEEQLFDQVGAIEVPGMGRVRAIAFPSNDALALSRCMAAYGKAAYLIPDKLEKSALALYPRICRTWEEIDAWLGQLLVTDSLIEKYAVAWHEGAAFDQVQTKPSLVEVIKHWAPMWQEKPYMGPQPTREETAEREAILKQAKEAPEPEKSRLTRSLQTPAELRTYQSELNAMRLVSLGMKEGQWLPSWNTLMPFLWKSRFLLPEASSHGVKARECMAACMLVSKMYDKMETFSHIGEPQFLDHDALAIWNVTAETVTPASDAQLSSEEQARLDKLEALFGKTATPVSESIAGGHSTASDSSFLVFAAWINGKNRAKATIERGWEAAWQMCALNWELAAAKPGVKISNFKPWLNVGDNFYLLRLADSWSPGDLCGFMSGNQYIKDADDMLLVSLGDGASSRIAGTLNKGQMDEIDAWMRQGENYRLVNKK